MESGYTDIGQKLIAFDKMGYMYLGNGLQYLNHIVDSDTS